MIDVTIFAPGKEGRIMILDAVLTELSCLNKTSLFREALSCQCRLGRVVHHGKRVVEADSLYVSSRSSNTRINRIQYLEKYAEYTQRQAEQPRLPSVPVTNPQSLKVDEHLLGMGQICYKEGKSQKAVAQSLQASLVREQKRDYHQVYDVVALIGEGSISNIYKIKKKEPVIRGSALKYGRSNVADKTRLKRRKTHSGELYALKEIDLAFVKEGYEEELRNEIDLLKELDHPNIIKAYETFLFKKKLSIVLELCTGGDLHKRHPYTEVQAAPIIQQVLSAVNYMHERKVIHRDIKYENIMFESKEPQAQVKLIDFGLATGYYKRYQTARVGTLYTMSPQVIEGLYTSKADLWSVGVVAYMLISGVKPFWGPTRKALTRSILKGEYDFDAEIWRNRSQEGKDFVSALLQLDPDKRLDAKQALKHPWLRRGTRLSDFKSRLERMEIAKTRLILYAESGEFKKIVMQVIAKKSRTEDILELRKVFNEFDSNQDGTITFDEFKKVLSRSNLSDEEVHDIFRKLDADHDDVIMYTEFIASLLETKGKIDEAKLVDAFDQLDTDNSGYISKADLKKILGNTWSAEYVDRLMKEADMDLDGQISYHDFKEYLAEKNAEHIRLVCE